MLAGINRRRLFSTAAAKQTTLTKQPSPMKQSPSNPPPQEQQPKTAMSVVSLDGDQLTHVAVIPAFDSKHPYNYYLLKQPPQIPAEVIINQLPSIDATTDAIPDTDTDKSDEEHAPTTTVAADEQVKSDDSNLPASVDPKSTSSSSSWAPTEWFNRISTSIQNTAGLTSNTITAAVSQDPVSVTTTQKYPLIPGNLLMNAYKPSIHGIPPPPPEFSLLPPPPVDTKQLTFGERISSFFRSIADRFNPVNDQEEVISIDTLITPPRSIAVIGIHGWFPSTKLVQTVFGERHGTSELLCDKMQTSLKEYWARNKWPLETLDSVTLIPLSTDGKILKRSTKLYSSLMGNVEKLNKLKQADMVMFSTHSQGTPVTFLLASRLLRENIIDPRRQRIGVLAMAGITHGPFPWMKGNPVVQYVEADAARELFEMCHSQDEVSDEHVVSQTWSAVKHVLDAGCKVTAVAAWMDQVVPIHSALMTAFSHPNILRAVHIDERNRKVDHFVLEVIHYLLRLRNMGISDRQMLVHLSSMIGSSLYNGVEHSTIYEEPKVFQTALDWMFHKTDTDRDCTMAYDFPTAVTHIDDSHRSNNYYLPWAMRSLLADPLIHQNRHLRDEMASLLELYQKWQPTLKVEKELKHRLDPIRSRL